MQIAPPIIFHTCVWAVVDNPHTQGLEKKALARNIAGEMIFFFFFSDDFLPLLFSRRVQWRDRRCSSPSSPRFSSSTISLFCIFGHKHVFFVFNKLFSATLLFADENKVRSMDRVFYQMDRHRDKDEIIITGDGFSSFLTYLCSFDLSDRETFLSNGIFYACKGFVPYLLLAWLKVITLSIKIARVIKALFSSDFNTQNRLVFWAHTGDKNFCKGLSEVSAKQFSLCRPLSICYRMRDFVSFFL